MVYLHLAQRPIRAIRHRIRIGSLPLFVISECGKNLSGSLTFIWNWIFLSFRLFSVELKSHQKWIRKDVLSNWMGIGPAQSKFVKPVSFCTFEHCSCRWNNSSGVSFAEPNRTEPTILIECSSVLVSREMFNNEYIIDFLLQTATERLRQFQMNGGPQHSFEETIHRVSKSMINIHFIHVHTSMAWASFTLQYGPIACGHFEAYGQRFRTCDLPLH